MAALEIHLIKKVFYGAVVPGLKHQVLAGGLITQSPGEEGGQDILVGEQSEKGVLEGALSDPDAQDDGLIIQDLNIVGDTRRQNHKVADLRMNLGSADELCAGALCQIGHLIIAVAVDTAQIVAHGRGDMQVKRIGKQQLLIGVG